MSIHSPKTSYPRPQRSTSSLLAVTLVLLAAPEPATAQIVPVCDRTPAVRDGIVNLVPEVNDCADVTEAHLVEVHGTLDLRGPELRRDILSGTPYQVGLPKPIGELKAGDFSGLTGLQHLMLSRNRFTTLPTGLFAGLLSLKTLDLAGNNRLTTLPEGVFSGLPSLNSLSLVLDDDYPNSILLDLFSELYSLPSLEGFSLAYNRVYALPAGIFSGFSSLTELTLYSAAGVLPEGLLSGLSSLQRLHLGVYSLFKFPEGLLSELPSLQHLHLVARRQTTLPPDIFSDLPSLKSLKININRLMASGSYREPTILPARIFSGLSSLQHLDLEHIGLSSLPPDIFSNLHALTTLNLRFNQMKTLPPGIFSGLSSLTTLNLKSNWLRTLPEGLFSGLSALEELYLEDNAIKSLPEGIFSGLFSLKQLRLRNNRKAPIYYLPIFVSLEQVGEDGFQARVNTGAPFDIVLPLTVANGTVDVGSDLLTIPTGHETSRVLSVSRLPGTTSAVTVDVLRFPYPPRDQSGYTLVRAFNFPETVLETHSLDFPHFVNGFSITSDLVFVNVAATPIQPALFFFDKQGDLIDPASVVDVGQDLQVRGDGGLTVRTEIEPLGELTISTHGRGRLVTGSVRVAADGPIGGALRFNNPTVGVAGVGTGSPVQDAIFPVRRQQSGINTGAAIRNLGEDPMTVTCQLMKRGRVLEETDIPLAGHGQTAQFIGELFAATDTSDFVGSVRCTAPEAGLFTGVALEIDFENPVSTTLPLVPVPQMRTRDYTQLHFAHFANGTSITSDLVFVNVASKPIRPVIYFYDGTGHLIAPESVVDLDYFEAYADGGLTIRSDIAPLGELTISTHGRGRLVTGSVKVIAPGPIGGFLRFDNPNVGVAGVGASEAVQDAIFPARHQARGIRTGMAIRNLKKDAIDIICQLMRDGRGLEEKEIPLAGHGQTAQFIHELFPQTVTSDFVGSVRCTAPEDGRFTGLALEMDVGNRIFTTLPVVPVRR